MLITDYQLLVTKFYKQCSDKTSALLCSATISLITNYEPLITGGTTKGSTANCYIVQIVSSGSLSRYISIQPLI